MHLPKWRKATWALVIWSGLMILWIVVGGGSAASDCANETGAGILSAQTAQDACSAGAGIGIAIIMVVAFFGFVALALIWLMSKPKDPPVQQIVYVEADPNGHALMPAARVAATGASAAAGGLDDLPAPFVVPRPAPDPSNPLGPYGR